MTNLTIAIVDDHPLMMEGIANVLDRRRGFSIHLRGSTSADMVKIYNESCPDVMIVDLNMPGDAFLAIENATKNVPHMKIIVFTASSNTDHAIRALEAGASGYVLKGSSADELIEAIEAVSQGAVYITPFFMSKVLSTLQHRALQRKESQRLNFSVRESQVVKLLLDGKQNREIAIALSLSEKTVKGYMTHLMQKLHARNRVEVVIAAQKMSTGTADAQHAML